MAEITRTVSLDDLMSLTLAEREAKEAMDRAEKEIGQAQRRAEKKVKAHEEASAALAAAKASFEKASQPKK